MHYYIDGYNLLFSTLSPHDCLEISRDTLIDDLNRKAAFLNIPITIVFDAHYQEGGLSITHYRHLEIIYSAYSQSADDLIIKILKTLDTPKATTLVTSDNKLAWRARHLLVKTEKVDAFLQYLNRRYESKIASQKEKKPRPQSPILRKSIEKSPPTQTPSDHTQDFYERIFTERLKEYEKETPKKEKGNYTPEPVKKQKRMQKKGDKKVEEQFTTDFERWLTIFERKDRDNEGTGA